VRAVRSRKGVMNVSAVVRATQTFTSGKRDNLENLGIVQVESAGAFGGHDWQGHAASSTAGTL